jgi:hypothetical protein
MKLLIGLLIMSFAGCASSTIMPESERAKIQSISINPEVKIPNDPIFIGSFLGIMGNDKGQHKEHMQKVNFDLSQIVKKQFKTQAEKRPFLATNLKTMAIINLNLKLKYMA